ncbi:Aminopeptidase 2 mitochondrial [Actinomortierella ambigua]|nr:Aminopeptidase 2 mitochondrial [Actinomortierella ambigua]
MTVPKRPTTILQRSILPVHYSLKIVPCPVNYSFLGQVTIEICIAEPTFYIALNAKELNIQTATVRDSLIDGYSITATSVNYSVEDETIMLEFPTMLHVGTSWILDITYIGLVNDKLTGFYRSMYTDANNNVHQLTTTQFQSTHARRAFPCWDEPSIKATFSLTLQAPQGMTCLSNMDILSTTLLENGMQEVTFNKTPIMPTYLLAWTIGDFDFIEAYTSGEYNESPLRCRVYTPVGLAEHGRYALDLAVKSVEIFARMFDMPHPLPKLDMVAIPDFAPGAMENWGLISFRIFALLVDEYGSQDRKRGIASTVVHEIAHQWFGNLVSMEWWSDLWLFEGFATFLAFVVVDEINPNWEVWTEFVNKIQEVLRQDSLRTSHPVEVEVTNPNDITQIFDEVSYMKGASVLRMLSAWLGQDQLLRGIRTFINKYMWSNANTEDLWMTLAEECKLDVPGFMAKWTRQTGYPVLSVVELDESTVLVRQNLYLSTGDVTPEEDNLIWPIPLSLSTASDGGNIQNITMDGKEMVLKIDTSQWYKFNMGQTGFYRVSYPSRALDLLGQTFGTHQLKAENRVGLLADSTAMVMSGIAPTSSFLTLLKYFEDEEQFVVWSEVSLKLTELLAVWLEEPRPIIEAMNEVQRRLFGKIVARLGWDYPVDEDPSIGNLRALAIRFAGRAGDPEIVQESRTRFTRFIKDRDMTAIHPELRFPVFEIVLRTTEGREEYDAVVNYYRESFNPSEKLVALTVLGYASNDDLVHSTVAFAMSDEVKTADILTAIATLRSSVNGRAAIWDFIRHHWDVLYERHYHDLRFLDYFLMLSIASFSSMERYQQVQDFFSTKDTSGFDRILATCLEGIRRNIMWLERDRQDVEDWLRSNGYLHAGAVAAAGSGSSSSSSPSSHPQHDIGLTPPAAALFSMNGVGNGGAAVGTPMAPSQSHEGINGGPVFQGGPAAVAQQQQQPTASLFSNSYSPSLGAVVSPSHTPMVSSSNGPSPHDHHQHHLHYFRQSTANGGSNGSSGGAVVLSAEETLQAAARTLELEMQAMRVRDDDEEEEETNGVTAPAEPVEAACGGGKGLGVMIDFGTPSSATSDADKLSYRSASSSGHSAHSSPSNSRTSSLTRSAKKKAVAMLLGGVSGLTNGSSTVSSASARFRPIQPKKQQQQQQQYHQQAPPPSAMGVMSSQLILQQQHRQQLERQREQELQKRQEQDLRDQQEFYARQQERQRAAALLQEQQRRQQASLQQGQEGQQPPPPPPPQQIHRHRQPQPHPPHYHHQYVQQQNGHEHADGQLANADATPTTEAAFPDHLYAQLTDAHCHIHDDRAGMERLVHAWRSSTPSNGKPEDQHPHQEPAVRAGKFCLMGVQPSAMLGQEKQNAPADKSDVDPHRLLPTHQYASSASYAETNIHGDWETVAVLAKLSPDRVVPCFGLHPWFTHKYYFDGPEASATVIMSQENATAADATTADATSTKLEGGGGEGGGEDPVVDQFENLSLIRGPGVRGEMAMKTAKALQQQMMTATATATATNDSDQAQHSSSSSSSSLAPSPSSLSDPYTHYSTILTIPQSAPADYLATMAPKLPTPRPFSPALRDLWQRLQAHPTALLGEIGLDRTARVPDPTPTSPPPPTIPEPPGSSSSSSPSTATATATAPVVKTTVAMTSIEHQLRIVQEQLRMAAVLDRAVSFHCVQAYGHWLDFLLRETKKLAVLEQQEQRQRLHFEARHGGVGNGATAAVGGGAEGGGGGGGAMPLSKRMTAKIRRQIQEAEWERHVASTLSDSSDDEEGEEAGDDEEDEGRDSKETKKRESSVTTTTTNNNSSSTPLPPPPPPPPPARSLMTLPPRLCMHSYGGSVDMIKAFLKLSPRPQMYFSFSMAINGRLNAQKFRDLVLAVPDDRLLVESDYHRPDGVVDATLVEMVRRVAGIKGWSLEETVERTARNWHVFVYGGPPL